MNGPALYNEIDPAAADWLEWLIGQGLIAPGVVDRRSIVDVQPEDLEGFAQVHLFAGIGGWSLAARLAGFRDDELLWTASCPCQPFSVAGKGAGRDDPRHLWPHVLRLARARRPARLVGEQVAGAAGYDWFDGVAADLEAEGYACRAVDIPACAVDAPHIRQRQYWAAVVNPARIGRGEGWAQPELRSWRAAVASADASGNVGHSVGARLEGQRGDGDAGGRSLPAGSAAPADGRNGTFWSDAEWITCHDGKARRTAPGIPLLVAGISFDLADVLRGIDLQAAEGAIAYAGSPADAAEAVRMVWDHDGAQALQGWCARVRIELPPEEVLLNFLLGVEATCRAGIGRRVPQAGGTAHRLDLFGLRGVVQSVRASYRREPEEQRVQQPADAVPPLPLFLARCAEASWLATINADAGHVRLSAARGGRVAAWKGFGNAIVPPLAAEVLKALKETTDA